MKVLYFAYLVDKLGRASEERTLPYGVNTAGGVLDSCAVAAASGRRR